MKSRLVVLLMCSLLSSVVFGQSSKKDTVRLFFLGGQSNMDGYGMVKDLPDSLESKYRNVWIFHGNPTPDGNTNGGLGKWDKLKPGHGAGFSSDGRNNYLSERFGVELSFAKQLQAYYPGEKIALIKYSRGGTSIDSCAAGSYGCWEPDFRGKNGINQYDHFLSTVRNALKLTDINKDGHEDVLIPMGIIWMQGEGDGSYNEAIANRYFFNLKRLMDLIRASLHKDDLPVVIGKISDSHATEEGKVWIYGELIQHAQEKFVRTDVNAAIVRSTNNYGYSDFYHYDSKGYIHLGSEFAKAVFQLNDK